MEKEEGFYAQAHSKILEALPFYKGKTFTSDDLCRQLGVQSRPEDSLYRTAINKVLYNIIYINKKPLLKVIGNRYALVERDLDTIDFSAPPPQGKEYPILFPDGRDDMSSFGFEDSVKFFPGDMMLLGGEGNKGKTAWCLNLAVANCNRYPITYFSSEFNRVKFEDRMSHFDWGDYRNGNGFKFEVVRRTKDFEDAIAERPDNFCIVDWVKGDDDLYKMSGLLGRMKDKVGDGFLVVALQKRSYKEVAEGGEGTLDFVDLYLTLSYEKLRVIKVKTPKINNPEGKIYGFQILNQGSKFSNIREIRICKNCWGKGVKYQKECELCDKGYVDV